MLLVLFSSEPCLEKSLAPNRELRTAAMLRLYTMPVFYCSYESAILGEVF